jgi:hypothetical protein
MIERLALLRDLVVFAACLLLLWVLAPKGFWEGEC